MDYELVLMLVPDLKELDVNEEFGKIKKTLVETTGGEVVKEDSWGKRHLAYEIGKHTQAHYAVWQLKVDADKLVPFEKKLKLNENVMRYLLVKR